MPTRLVSLAAVAILALGVAGCSPDRPAAPAPVTAAPTTTAAAPSNPASPQATPGDPAEHNAAALRAIATAEQATNGKAHEIDDRWEVEVIAGDRSIEVKVSADGNTVASRDDHDTADDDDRARLGGAQVTLTQAIEAALREVPGSLDDAELDHKDDRDVWEVSIDTPEKRDIEVYVSPQDGSIIKVDR